MSPAVLKPAVLAAPDYEVTLVERVERGQSKHYYKINNGKELPGVTGILSVISKPALIPWAVKQALLVVQEELFAKLNGQMVGSVMISTEYWENLVIKAKARPDKIKEDAGDVGTRAHAWIDAFIKGKPLPEQTEDIKMACDNFLRFWKSEGLTFIAGDTKVASATEGYGGSLDWLAVDKKGDWILGDLKTSNGIWPEYGVQLGGYSLALMETYGCRATRGLILRVGKEDVEFERGWVNDLVTAERAFINAKNLKQTLADKNFLIKESEHNDDKSTRKAGPRKRV